MSQKNQNEQKLRRSRTEAQNRALHKLYTDIAEALTHGGFDVRVVLEDIASKGVDMYFTPTLVKEILWRPIQKKMFAKKSTTELDSIGEIEKIYDALNKYLGETYYIHVPFPSIESLMEHELQTPSRVTRSQPNETPNY